MLTWNISISYTLRKRLVIVIKLCLTHTPGLKLLQALVVVAALSSLWSANCNIINISVSSLLDISTVWVPVATFTLTNHVSAKLSEKDSNNAHYVSTLATPTPLLMTTWQVDNCVFQIRYLLTGSCIPCCLIIQCIRGEGEEVNADFLVRFPYCYSWHIHKV
jgi:hypothetical protein